MMQTQSMAYILLHFPYLTETFVADEIGSVRSLGIDARIVSLLEPGRGPVQPLSQALLRYVWYAPGLLSQGLWRAQLHFLFKSPRLYVGLLTQLLRQPCPRQPLALQAKRLVIFLKAAATAYHLRDTHVQQLHAHFAWLAGAAAWICARLLGLPFTVTMHAYDLYASNDLLPLVSHEANHIIAASEYNRRYLETTIGCPPHQVSTIYSGVNLSAIQGQVSESMKRPANGTIRLLSVGSLLPKKGHSYLIAACYLLKQRGIDFTCTIIGGGPDEAALQRQIQAFSLQDQVKLLGPRPQPQVIAACHQHDIFVLASVVTPNGDRDNIPTVLMEAGATGLPLVSTEVAGIPELVRHGQTGWLIPSGDPNALADAIAVLAADPALRARLGQNARTLVETEFSTQDNVLRLVEVFSKTCQGWRQGWLGGGDTRPPARKT